MKPTDSLSPGDQTDTSQRPVVHPGTDDGYGIKALPAYPGNVSAHEYERMLSPRALRRHRPGAGKLLRIIMAVLIVTAVVVLLIMRTHTSDLDKATISAEKFVATMQSNQPDKAYAMGNDAFRKATTEQELAAMLDRTEPFLDKARIDLVDSYYATSKTGDPRTILVFMATKGKQVVYIRLVMERQEDLWKAHSLLTQSTPLQAKPE